MSKLRALWRNGRGMLFVVLVGIAFYEMLEHFSSVRAVISRTTSVLMPILCGLMVAYIINIPATILQGTLFKKAHAAGKKYVVPLTVVLSYLIVFGILTAVLIIVIPKAADSVKILFDNFETYYNSAAKWATEFWEGLNLSDEVTARAVEISNKILDNVEVFTTNLAPKLLGYTFNAVSTVADILLALAFSIYAILDKNRLLAHSRRFVRSVFNEKHSSGILEVFFVCKPDFSRLFCRTDNKLHDNRHIVLYRNADHEHAVSGDDKRVYCCIRNDSDTRPVAQHDSECVHNPYDITRKA